MMTKPNLDWLKPSANERVQAPFESGEEAWFWFVRTEKAKADGVRPRAGADTARPCEPADIYRCVSRLYHENTLYPLHLEVLGEYGFPDRMPYPDDHQEIVDWILWQDAMDHLEPCLRERGIIQ